MKLIDRLSISRVIRMVLDFLLKVAKLYSPNKGDVKTDDKVDPVPENPPKKRRLRRKDK